MSALAIPSWTQSCSSQAGADQADGHRYVVSPAGDEWELLREDEKGTVPLYAFRDVPHELDEYEAMCTFHQTSPESHFTRNWICSRATRTGGSPLPTCVSSLVRRRSGKKCS